MEQVCWSGWGLGHSAVVVRQGGRGISCGKFLEGKIFATSQIPKLTLPHAHTKGPISRGEIFTTFFRDEIFPRSYPRSKLSHEIITPPPYCAEACVPRPSTRLMTNLSPNPPNTIPT